MSYISRRQKRNIHFLGFSFSGDKLVVCFWVSSLSVSPTLLICRLKLLVDQRSPWFSFCRYSAPTGHSFCTHLSGAHQNMCPFCRRSVYSACNRCVPRFGTQRITLWYLAYHALILSVSRFGTQRTTLWYWQYLALVLTVPRFDTKLVRPFAEFLMQLPFLQTIMISVWTGVILKLHKKNQGQPVQTSAPSAMLSILLLFFVHVRVLVDASNAFQFLFQLFKLLSSVLFH